MGRDRREANRLADRTGVQAWIYVARRSKLMNPIAFMILCLDQRDCRAVRNRRSVLKEDNLVDGESKRQR